MDGEKSFFDWRLLRSHLPWFLPVLLLSALFLFCCSITVVTFPGWPAAVLIKKYGVMLGLVLILAGLVPQVLRGQFTDPAPWGKVALHGVLLFALLSGLLLGLPHLGSFGGDFATLSTNYWSADYTDMRSTLLKRVALPALAHLFGFRESTYIFFWFGVLFAAVLLAGRLFIVEGLSFIESLSMLTASLFVFQMVVPGYNEVLILALALFCMQRTTSFLDKWVLFLLAVATHEVAAVVMFFSLLLFCPRKDRGEWFVIFPLMIGIYLAAGLAIGWLQKGERPPEALLILGKTAWKWGLTNPYLVAGAIVMAYKLYWVVPFLAWRQPELRIAALATVASVPLILIAVDGSRLVQFTSLTIFLLAPRVFSNWTPRARLALATVNLLVPSVVVETWVYPLWGRGVYTLYLALARHLGLSLGGVCHF